MRVAIIDSVRSASGGYTKHLANLLPEVDASNGKDCVEVFGADGDFRKRILSFAPDVALSLTARPLNIGRCPIVTMVRNMEPFEALFGENPPIEIVRNIVRLAGAYIACRQAARIIAVSDHVRNVLVRRWSIRPEKIGVVPHGVGPPSVGKRPPSAIGLPSRSFMFCAGSIRPARGLTDVISAMSIGRKRGLNTTVLIAGSVEPAMKGYRHKLDELAATGGVGGQVIWAGVLSAEEMSWCYTNARAFIMSSRAEACPNVVLEAMAHGCMSISTDHPPMPAFFGDSAFYYRARDPADLASKFLHLERLTAQSEIQHRADARKLASALTWNRTAMQTLQQLRLTIASEPGCPIVTT